MIKINTFLKRINETAPPRKALILIMIFNALLIVYSAVRTENITYLFLGWNLLLAWVPYRISVYWRTRLSQEKEYGHWKSTILFGIWLLFLPNAPYLITDLVHLNIRFNPALWSDTLVLFTAAMTGVLLCIYSLHNVHRALVKMMSEFITWLVLVTSIFLCGFGIFLGRVLRWNSWDLFLQPYKLLRDSFRFVQDPLAIQMTIGFSSLLLVSYFVFKTIVSYERDKDQH